MVDRLKFVVSSQINLFCQSWNEIQTCYSENEVISMLEFLIDSICVEFGGHIVQQIIAITMETNSAPLLADLALYFCEAFQRQNKLQKLKPSHFQVYWWCLLIIQTLVTYLGSINIHQRTWDKGHNRNSFLCLISWHLLWIRHQLSTS
jgi:hypothetical protein